MTIFNTPRWMHQHLTVPYGQTLRSTPALFTNDTMWPMEIVWLAQGGPSLYGGPASGFATDVDGLPRRTRVEVGITQQGDINYVPLNGHAFFAPSKPLRQLWGHQYPGSRFDFAKPFVLGPEETLNCIFTNTDQAVSSPKTWSYPGIVINGHRFDATGKKWPVQLASYYKGSVSPGTNINLDPIDLRNNGETPVYLTDFCIFSGDAYTDNKDFTLTKCGWQINPSSGVQWMPNPFPISAGMVAPLNEMSNYSDTVWPQAWELPKGCKLFPRQQIVFEVTNLMSSGTDLHCEFSAYCNIEVQ